MRVAGLFRVSTEKQENEGTSLDAQRRRFRELAAKNGWDVVAEFRGQESAAKAVEERAVLQLLLASIREDGVEAVWVIEQSRLTRADELEVALLMRELRERRVVVIVDERPRDLNTIDERFMFRIQSAVDEAEHARIRERMMRGKRERNMQGRKASGTTAYGYENPPHGHPLRGQIQVVPHEAAVVHRIFTQIAAGAGVRATALQLTAEGVPAPRGGRWGKSTIRRILDNPVYRGVQLGGAWQKEPGSRSYKLDLKRPAAVVVEGAHEAIVSAELWAAARAQLGGTSNGRPGMLTGMLWVNGQRAWIDGGHGQSFYCPADRLPGAWLPVKPLNDLAWGAFVSLFGNPEALQRLFGASEPVDRPASFAGELEALRAQKAKLAARLSRLVEMRADGEITKGMFEERSRTTRQAMRETEESLRIAAERAETSSSDKIKRTLDVFGYLVRGELKVDAEYRRRAMRTLLETIHVEAERRATAQPRSRGGQYTRTKAPQWRARNVFFRLRPSPEAATTSASSGQLRPRLTVQVVADGRVLAAPRQVPDRWSEGVA